MQSTAINVTDYLEETPIERRQCLHEMRRLCRETLAGYTEGMYYGMPGYSKDGVVEVGFNSQKNYISLYILKPAVMEANRPLLKGINCGKGCIRYSRPEAVDFSVVRKLLEETLTSPDTAC